MRPSTFSGERSGLAVGQGQDLDALEAHLDVGAQDRTDLFAGRHQRGVQRALGLACTRGAPGPGPVCAWLVNSMSIRRDMRRTRYRARHRPPMPVPMGIP